MYPKNSWFTFVCLMVLLNLGFLTIEFFIGGPFHLMVYIISGAVVGGASDYIHKILYKKYGPCEEKDG